MYSEDFHGLVYGNKKAVSDYIQVGTANLLCLQKL